MPLCRRDDLDPERLVFIDGTWTATDMTRSHGRCRRDERLRMGYPHGRRETATLVAGLHTTGMVARGVNNFSARGYDAHRKETGPARRGAPFGV